MNELTITLREQEADYLMKALAQRPIAEAGELYTKLLNQLQKQIDIKPSPQEK